MSADLFAPTESPVWAQDRAAAWNAAEAAESRKNSTVAREYQLALPAELTDTQRRELVQAFCHELVETHGVLVDAAIHAPDKRGDQRNFHCHILTSTRRLDAAGFGEKTRELDDRAAGRAFVLKWRARWAELTNEALARAGHDVRIDHRSFQERGIALDPSTHVGPAGTALDRSGQASERAAEAARRRAENATRIEANPGIILAAVASRTAVFRRQDVAVELVHYIDDREQYQRILAQLDASPELVRVNATDPKAEPLFSTREMIQIEQRMADNARALASQQRHGLRDNAVDNVIARVPALSAEQVAAVRHITDARGLAVVVGDAGTGKSYSMRIAREAWESSGYRVIGAALAGKAAGELQQGSGIQSRTLASLERTWKRMDDGEQLSAASAERARLDARTVLVIDEAGMIGSRQLERVLDRAERAGAKVVLLGDHKQLAAIEAGAALRTVVARQGAAELTSIRRQREAWQRDASAELARGSVQTALNAYREHGAVQIVASREAAREEIARAWLADRVQSGSALILAHTRNDVDALNQAVRSARQQAGELGSGMSYMTDSGRAEFSPGDRVVFGRNDATLGVTNGSLGTVRETAEGRLVVELDDAAGGPGRVVDVETVHYGAVSHGYAVTIHKSQGATVDRAYVLATPDMDRSLAYVAATRHRDTLRIVAGRDDFGGYDRLAEQLARERPKLSTLDFCALRGDGRAAAVDDARAGIAARREALDALGARACDARVQAYERAGMRRPAWRTEHMATTGTRSADEIRRAGERVVANLRRYGRGEDRLQGRAMADGLAFAAAQEKEAQRAEREGRMQDARMHRVYADAALGDIEADARVQRELWGRSYDAPTARMTRPERVEPALTRRKLAEEIGRFEKFRRAVQAATSTTAELRRNGEAQRVQVGDRVAFGDAHGAGRVDSIRFGRMRVRLDDGRMLTLRTDAGRESARESAQRVREAERARDSQAWRVGKAGERVNTWRKGKLGALMKGVFMPQRARIKSISKQIDSAKADMRVELRDLRRAERQVTAERVREAALARDRAIFAGVRIERVPMQQRAETPAMPTLDARTEETARTLAVLRQVQAEGGERGRIAGERANVIAAQLDVARQAEAKGDRQRGDDLRGLAAIQAKDAQQFDDIGERMKTAPRATTDADPGLSTEVKARLAVELRASQGTHEKRMETLDALRAAALHYQRNPPQVPRLRDRAVEAQRILARVDALMREGKGAQRSGDQGKASEIRSEIGRVLDKEQHAPDVAAQVMAQRAERADMLRAATVRNVLRASEDRLQDKPGQERLRRELHRRAELIGGYLQQYDTARRTGDRERAEVAREQVRANSEAALREIGGLRDRVDRAEPATTLAEPARERGHEPRGPDFDTLHNRGIER